MRLAALYGIAKGKSDFEELLPLGEISSRKLAFKEIKVSGGEYKGRKFERVIFVPTGSGSKRVKFDSVEKSIEPEKKGKKNGNAN